MHGVKLVQLKVRATPRQITLLRKAATQGGLGTPAEFLVAALFDGNHLAHRHYEAYRKRRPYPKRTARPEL
jgi:hypothetical protein